MLCRSDLCHEPIVCAARDRIVALSKENERLRRIVRLTVINIDRTSYANYREKETA